MQTPEPLHGRLTGGVDRVGIADVDHDRMHRRARVAQTRDVTVERTRIDVGHHHLHALRGERLGNGQADAARRSGHDRGASFESIHDTTVRGPR